MGNAEDFGDLTRITRDSEATSSPTRAIFGGGYASPGGVQNTIDYIQFANKGDATDFGDLTRSHAYPGALSNGHGGL